MDEYDDDDEFQKWNLFHPHEQEYKVDIYFWLLIDAI